MNHHLCQRVEHELVDLIEPGASDPELEAHLDECDDCALTVARAARTAASIATLGREFVLPADMIQRVVDSTPTVEKKHAPPKIGALWGAVWNTLPGRLVLLGSGLAVAIWAVLAAPPRETTPNTPAPKATVLKLEAIDGGKPVAHLRGRDGAWTAVRPGDEIALDRPLRTGGGTRARLALQGQGVDLRLNRATTITSHRGTLRLVGGELLADVDPRKNGVSPLVIAVPTGRVEVLGTKLHVSASTKLALVDVVHGTVRVRGATGAHALVSAGQEAALVPGSSPMVGMAPDLGRVLSWSHSEGPSAEPAPSGLGSLEARRPGHKGRAIPLHLKEHTVKVRVHGGLARTEITETFDNSTRHTLEGIYRFPLPTGARISRLALYVDGRLEEGTVVERDRATKIWRGVIRQATPKKLRKKKEEYIWVPGPWRDPALLQWREGNQFELRIFPIPARGSRKVILAYTESLPRTARGRRYVYPLPRPGSRSESELSAGRFSFDLELAGHDPLAPIRTSPQYALKVKQRSGSDRLSYSAEPFKPRGDLLVDFATRAATSSLVVQTYGSAGALEPGYALLSLKTQLPSYRSDQPRDIILLVDRSHSTIGEAGRRALMLTQAMVEEMDRRDRLTVLACDSVCQTVASAISPTTDEARRIVTALGRIKPGGATNLGEAMRRVGELLAARSAPARRRARVIYLGDGMPTVGELAPAKLTGQVRKHLGPHHARLTTVGVGSSVDGTVLGAMARTAGGTFVAYGPGTTVKGQALQVLARQYGVTLEQVKVELPAGIAQVAPAAPPVLHQGQELVLVGRASGRIKGQLVLTGRVNGEPFRAVHQIDATVSGGEGNAFLPRLWAQLTVDQLQTEDSERHRGTIVALSKRHYLLTRHTSLLVLESEAMRRAFGVAQGRRAEEWTGGVGAKDGNKAAQLAARSGVLGTLRGRRAEQPGTDAEDALEGLLDGDSHGGGAPGFLSGGTGQGYGGGGKGFGRGGGSVGKGRIGVRDHVPGSVVPRSRGAAVRGALDKEIIRRVIRRHINQIKYVYQKQLKRNPSLVGRTVVDFTIGPGGRVVQVSLRGGSFGDRQLERDMVRVISRWRFPAPKGGGTVRVSYPFVFRTAGNGPPPVLARPNIPTVPAPGVLGGRSRGWVRMKRIYYQEAALNRIGVNGPSSHDLRLVDRRRRELAENPDSRDRHRRLFRALSRSGAPLEALAVLQAWLVRDPNSPEALTFLSETAARLGRRQQALRALGSLVELDHRSSTLHARLAALYQALGSTRAACAHWVSLATVDRRNRSQVTRRARDCREGYRPPRQPAPAHGTVVLAGRWSGGEDLDLALVTGRGQRIAWTSNRPRIRYQDVASPALERLAVRWLAPGRYRIEVSRADEAGDDLLQGSVMIRAPGLRRRVRFRLAEAEQRRYVAELQIHRRSRLVSAP